VPTALFRFRRDLRLTDHATERPVALDRYVRVPARA
jgi:hypothetical protein